MPFHTPHSEEDAAPEPEWEWVGPDGLTDSQRAVQAEQYRQGPGRDLTSDEVKALLGLAKADMLPRVKLEELPT